MKYKNVYTDFKMCQYLQNGWNLVLKYILPTISWRLTVEILLFSRISNSPSYKQYHNI